MKIDGFSVERLLSMRHSTIRNYIVPGLSSSLIGSPSPQGTVRLFECSREQREEITPHSHRFAFQCCVLRGTVSQRLWHRGGHCSNTDAYMESRMVYMGEQGKYELHRGEKPTRFHTKDKIFNVGECYSMEADEIHSIHFSRDAMVLFFEGPQVSNESIILEPFVDGEVVPTFKVEPWMFKR